MESYIVCYVPVVHGARLDEQSWGLADIAGRLARPGLKTLAIIAHAGLDQDVLASLPFDYVWHVPLTPEQWRSADGQLELFRSCIQPIEHLCELVLFSAKPFYQEIAVRASLGGGLITNASEIEWPEASGLKQLTVKREIYAGKAHEFVRFKDTESRYVTFGTAHLYGTPSQGAPQVTEVRFEPGTYPRLHYISGTPMNWRDMDLTKASCVIGIGRGVHETDSMHDILQLAEILNAPIGGSKVADELGLTPRDKRIGSSGSAIHADVYIAIGVSGSSQHLEGIKGVKRVIAINIDPAAPIFQRCQLGIVGDAGEVVRMLIAALQQERQSDGLDEDLRAG